MMSNSCSYEIPKDFYDNLDFCDAVYVALENGHATDKGDRAITEGVVMNVAQYALAHYRTVLTPSSVANLQWSGEAPLDLNQILSVLKFIQSSPFFIVQQPGDVRSLGSQSWITREVDVAHTAQLNRIYRPNPSLTGGVLCISTFASAALQRFAQKHAADQISGVRVIKLKTSRARLNRPNYFSINPVCIVVGFAVVALSFLAIVATYQAIKE